jgi:ParB-like chromosome segregation protein Spo0J
LHSADPHRGHNSPDWASRITKSHRTHRLNPKTRSFQPIVVTPIGSRYRVLAGKRRYHACQALGWSTIPVIILSVNDQLAELIAIDTNLTRERLAPSERDELRRRRREISAMISKQRKNRNSPRQAQRHENRKANRSPAGNTASRIESTPRTILQLIGRLSGIHGKSYRPAALF